MDRGQHAGQGPGTGPGIRLATIWADSLKALSIYPDTNERVRAKLDAVLTAARELLQARGRSPQNDAERGVSILFRHDTVHVDEERGEAPAGSPLLWLRERLAHAGLAGAELMPALDTPALVAFCKRLLANFLRKEPGLSFDDLWPDTYAGIVLIDRRFEGTFGGLEAQGPYAGGHAGTSIRAADTSHFLRGLLAHPKVSTRVLRLSGEATTRAEESVGASQLLKQILDEVPAESLNSRDALIGAVCRGLDQMGTRSAAAAPRSDGSGVADSGEFASLLYQVSRTHFARKGPGLERLKPDHAEPVERGPAGGRARDANIEDDVHSLVAELADLPSSLAYNLAAGDAECKAEQLATYLYFLTHLEQPAQLPSLVALCGRALEDAGPREVALLREYLLAAHDTGNVAAFLVETGRASLLRACGLLTPEYVLADPGTRLPLLLAALEPRSREQLAEVNLLCTHLGTDLLDLADRLRAPLAALPRDVAAAVFERPHPARLPLVRILLEVHPGRLVPESTVFLRSLDLPHAEAFLLFQLHDMRYLTRAYLCALIDLHLERADAEPLHRAIVDLLCNHIRATQTPLPEHPERVASIRALALHPSAQGFLLLKELQKTAFGPFGGTEPAAIRKLAKAVAKKFGAADRKTTAAGSSTGTGAETAATATGSAPDASTTDDGHFWAA
ncbi:MAG: hypothetical protein O2894_12415 [Planctomycetota bacterium]|nr:hypothetical protein [Planctomycetota bacterium]